MWDLHGGAAIHVKATKFAVPSGLLLLCRFAELLTGESSFTFKLPDAIASLRYLM